MGDIYTEQLRAQYDASDYVDILPTDNTITIQTPTTTRLEIKSQGPSGAAILDLYAYDGTAATIRLGRFTNGASTVKTQWLNNSTTVMAEMDHTTGSLQLDGNLQVDGNTTLGNASTDTITNTGRNIQRTINSATPSSDVAGSTGEIAFNSSDTKFYGCTVGGAAGAATWVALH